MENKAQAGGALYLKIVGVILMIFSTISMFIYSLAAIGVSIITDNPKFMDMTSLSLASSNKSLTMVCLVLMAVLSLYGLFVGVVGVANSNKPERYQLTFILGIVLFVLQIFGGVVVFWFNGVSFSSAILTITGLLLPLLYIYGAYLNKRKQT